MQRLCTFFNQCPNQLMTNCKQALIAYVIPQERREKLWFQKKNKKVVGTRIFITAVMSHNLAWFYSLFLQRRKKRKIGKVPIFFKHLFEIMTVKAVYDFFFPQDWRAYWAMTFKSIMGKEHKLKIHNQCLVTYSHCQLVDTTDAVWCYMWKGVTFVSTMLATLWLQFTSSFNHGIQLKLVPTKFNHQ